MPASPPVPPPLPTTSRPLLAERAHVQLAPFFRTICFGHGMFVQHFSHFCWDSPTAPPPSPSLSKPELNALPLWSWVIVFTALQRPYADPIQSTFIRRYLLKALQGECRTDKQQLNFLWTYYCVFPLALSLCSHLCRSSLIYHFHTFLSLLPKLTTTSNSKACVCVEKSTADVPVSQSKLLSPADPPQLSADTTSSSSCTHWESSVSWWPSTLLCPSCAGRGCTPWGCPTSTTSLSTTTTVSSSSCCPTSHVRSPGFFPNLMNNLSFEGLLGMIHCAKKLHTHNLGWVKTHCYAAITVSQLKVRLTLFLSKPLESMH